MKRLLLAAGLAGLCGLTSARTVAQDEAALKIVISKEIYEKRPASGGAPWLVDRYVGPALEREEIHGLLVASDTTEKRISRLSVDNGRTWSDFEPRPNTTLRYQGLEVRENEGPVLYDPAAKVLVGTWLRQIPIKGLWHNFTYYRLSWDFGRTWTAPRQLTYEEGDDFDPNAPHATGFLEKNNAYFGTSILRHSSGELVFPVAHANAPNDPENDKRAWRMGALCFVGRWDASSRNYAWRAGRRAEISPETSSRGLMEPDLAELRDGRVLVVYRGSDTPKTTGRKWFCLSDDRGLTLSPPEEWRYDDGTRFYSPSSFHRFVRHSVTGKLYWVGNICDAPPRGNRPRYPLVIGEVDEEKAAIKRGSVVVVDDRRPDQQPAVQFSNFSLLENRETHVLELTLTPLGGEPGSWLNADVYRYSIRLDGE